MHFRKETLGWALSCFYKAEMGLYPRAIFASAPILNMSPGCLCTSHMVS